MAAPGFNVSATMFDAARLYVSSDLIRLSVGGVFVQPHPVAGALIVATDGHRLVVIYDADGSCRGPVTVRVEKACASALKAARSHDRITLDAGGCLAIPDTYSGHEPAVMATTFPDYPRLIAGIVDNIVAKTSGPASFNGDYLGDLGKVGRRLTNTKGSAARIITFGPSEAALTLWPAAPHAFGLLMPMRSDGASAVPLFFKPVLSPTRKKRAPAKKRERVE